MTIRLGKLKIYSDFKLRINEKNYQPSNRALKWSPSSNMQAAITNELNIGCEILTCLTPNHPRYPASIINAKIDDFKLFVSRRVVQTLLRFNGIYQNGSKSLCLFNAF